MTPIGFAVLLILFIITMSFSVFPDVKEAIARVTGRKYRLGIYSNPVTQQKAEEKQDPLAGLLQKAQQLGVLQE